MSVQARSLARQVWVPRKFNPGEKERLRAGVLAFNKTALTLSMFAKAKELSGCTAWPPYANHRLQTLTSAKTICCNGSRRSRT